ncbi:MAG: hypothetical protein RR052_04050 [Oscillospiraceae bacterium]
MNKDLLYFSKNSLFLICSCIFCVICLAKPQLTGLAFYNGLENCYYKVIPSIFPLLVVTGMLYSLPYSRFLGIVFVPYLKLLGIKSKYAGTAILFSLIGGFAVFSNIISSAIKSNQLTKNEAEILLCIGVSTGPAFIIATVGGVLLNNITQGVFLFLSLTLASFISAIIIKSICFKKENSSTSIDVTLQSVSPLQAFVTAIKNAVTACLNMCGFVIFFNILTSLLEKSLGETAKLVVFSSLEVTKATIYATTLNGNFKVIAIIFSLSVVSFSIIMQSKSLLPENISFIPFYISRIFHFPLSCGIYFILCHIFPLVQTVSIAKIKPLRFDLFTSIIFIVMVFSMLYECTSNFFNSNKVFTKK